MRRSGPQRGMTLGRIILAMCDVKRARLEVDLVPAQAASSDTSNGRYAIMINKASRLAIRPGSQP